MEEASFDSMWEELRSAGYNWTYPPSARNKEVMHALKTSSNWPSSNMNKGVCATGEFVVYIKDNGRKPSISLENWGKLWWPTVSDAFAYYTGRTSASLIETSRQSSELPTTSSGQGATSREINSVPAITPKFPRRSLGGNLVDSSSDEEPDFKKMKQSMESYDCGVINTDEPPASGSPLLSAASVSEKREADLPSKHPSLSSSSDRNIRANERNDVPNRSSDAPVGNHTDMKLMSGTESKIIKMETADGHDGAQSSSLTMEPECTVIDNNVHLRIYLIKNAMEQLRQNLMVKDIWNEDEINLFKSELVRMQKELNSLAAVSHPTSTK